MRRLGLALYFSILVFAGFTLFDKCQHLEIAVLGSGFCFFACWIVMFSSRMKNKE